MQTVSTEAPPFSHVQRQVNLLWDQSLVWGLICIETLNRFGVPFRLLNARDVADGLLEDGSVLLVPGGWASHKVRALGEAGKKCIRDFIEKGGSYLGFCGGAGLALSGGSNTLELVPMERMPPSERLPSASGEVHLRGIPHHPAWKNLPETVPASIWWPSQFWWQPLPRSLCLATYAHTGSDFWVADLSVSDLKNHSPSWTHWEETYGINLDPQRLLGQPAILEVRLGRGRLVLSYPHLETPEDSWGNRLFLNVLGYLDEKASSFAPGTKAPLPSPSPSVPPTSQSLSELASIHESVQDLISLGRRHLLWKWRNPWLLQWRRGIRGLEYGTLAVTVGFLFEEATKLASNHSSYDPWLAPVKRLRNDVQTFCRSAKYLLMEEELIFKTGRLPKLGQVNETVDRLRSDLFGNRMNHGGLCGIIFDQIDLMLFEILRLGIAAAGSFQCST